MALADNTLYYGDNLEVLRDHIPAPTPDRRRSLTPDRRRDF